MPEIRRFELPETHTFEELKGIYERRRQTLQQQGFYYETEHQFNSDTASDSDKHRRVVHNPVTGVFEVYVNMMAVIEANSKLTPVALEEAQETSLDQNTNDASFVKWAERNGYHFYRRLSNTQENVTQRLHRIIQKFNGEAWSLHYDASTNCFYIFVKRKEEVQSDPKVVTGTVATSLGSKILEALAKAKGSKAIPERSF